MISHLFDTVLDLVRKQCLAIASDSSRNREVSNCGAQILLNQRCYSHPRPISRFVSKWDRIYASTSSLNTVKCSIVAMSLEETRLVRVSLSRELDDSRVSFENFEFYDSA